MAKFVFAVWPLRSHYFGLVPIAQALIGRGHEVAFYTGARSCAALEAEGLRCFPFKRVDEEWVERLFFNRETYAAWNAALRTKRLLKSWLLGTVPAQVEDLEEVVREWCPDVILSETSMWGPMLILSDKGTVPVAVYSTVIACLLPGPEAPPYGTGWPPPRNWRIRLAMRLVEWVRPLLVADFQRTANALRADHGLEPLDVTVTEHTGRMPLYIVPGVREFDYNRRDLPASVQYVGPCAWNRTREDVTPDWLLQLPRQPPVVHVTEGTMHSQKPVLLQAAVKGLGNAPMQVIMTAGGHRDPEELGLGPLPSNIRLEGWVAHGDLLPRTDVVVTTGGAGTISAILEAGVPSVIVPTEWDKPENARRVAELGVGIYLAPRKCNPERLRAAVDRVLADPSFKENARKMQAVWCREDGPARAAELLESLAESAEPGRDGTERRKATRIGDDNA